MRFLSFLFSIIWHALIIGLLIYYPFYKPVINLKERHIYEVELIKLTPERKREKSKLLKKTLTRNKISKRRSQFYPKKPAFVRNITPPVHKREPIPIPARKTKKKNFLKKKVPYLPTPAKVKKSILARALRDITMEAEKEEKQKRIVEEEVKRLEKQTMENPPFRETRDNMELYLKIAEQKIKQNWRYPLITGRSLRAEVQIIVNKQGKILSYKIIKSSGRQDFDNSVIKSILETKVLPPPPGRDKHIRIIISFMSENNP